MKLIVAITCLSTLSAFGQKHNPNALRVLFIGNSYIYENSLPYECKQIAISMGNDLIIDSSTHGGYTLRDHLYDSISLNKIKAGYWNYVVLQEQSQLPSSTDKEAKNTFFKSAHILDSIIHVYNPQCKTIFYMTWGRKNGDSFKCKTWKPVCTYTGMDSLISLRYITVAKMNHSIVSPVGSVWNYIRKNYPSIELYQEDDSHPSRSGTYTAACCFYTIMFKRNPLLIKYISNLNFSDALKIKL